jgi:adenylate cyclase
MAIEIERKFLVTDLSWKSGLTGKHYLQGYIAEQDGVTVRVRMAGDVGRLTVKGPSTGASRAEFEYTIPADDVAEMLATLCPGGRIDKTRYRVPVGAHVWEVDVFHGDNEGLVLAEVELGAEDEAFELPPWAGEDVTEDGRYYNVYLARHPWKRWPGH